MCDYVVKRAAVALPQSTTESLFSVTGGDVLLTGLYGTVTSAVQASQITSLTVYLGANDTFGLQVDVTSAPAGDLIGLDSSTYPVGVLSDAVHPFPIEAVVLASGSVVSAQCGHNSTGQVSWTLMYRPIEPGASVAAL